MPLIWKMTRRTAILTKVPHLRHLIPKSRMRALASEMRDRTTRRTRGGKSANNRRFRAYTSAYALQKGVGRQPVTLEATGAMLRSFVVQAATTKSFTLGIKRGASKVATRAAAHQLGLGHMPKREWIGFTAADKKFMKAAFTDELRALTRARRGGL